MWRPHRHLKRQSHHFKQVSFYLILELYSVVLNTFSWSVLINHSRWSFWGLYGVLDINSVCKARILTTMSLLSLKQIFCISIIIHSFNDVIFKIFNVKKNNSPTQCKYSYFIVFFPLVSCGGYMCVSFAFCIDCGMIQCKGMKIRKCGVRVMLEVLAEACPHWYPGDHALDMHPYHTMLWHFIFPKIVLFY